MMKHKGYIAEVEFDEDAEIFFGTVLNTNDTITFQSENAHELRKEFEESVEDYLSFCAECDQAPEKPFSGRFMLRLSNDLHRKVYISAMRRKQSLNEFIRNTLKQAVRQ